MNGTPPIFFKGFCPPLIGFVKNVNREKDKREKEKKK